jgi:hypothetical protein
MDSANQSAVVARLPFPDLWLVSDGSQWHEVVVAQAANNAINTAIICGCVVCSHLVLAAALAKARCFEIPPPYAEDEVAAIAGNAGSLTDRSGVSLPKTSLPQR